jgi:octaprenyl-diphosphate synthase
MQERLKSTSTGFSYVKQTPFPPSLQKDLQRVNRVWSASLRSDNPYIRKMMTHLEKGGGKRIRPALVLLSAQAFGEVTGSVVALGAAVEMLHVATLIHDDIIDHAALRRKQKTLNFKWGNEASVLMGDYLFSSVYSLLARQLPSKVMENIAETTHAICRGEITETFNRFNPKLTEERYLSIAHDKTASLFAVACQTGAMLSGADENSLESMRCYGMSLGMAFQLVDDALDYDGRSIKLGKPKGSDFKEGKITLPVLHALQVVGSAEKIKILKLISKPVKTAGDFQRISMIVRQNGSATYTRERAERFIQQAEKSIAGLKNDVVQKQLVQIARFAVQRDY